MQVANSSPGRCLRRRDARRGFSYAELLCVLVVIGILTAWLLPAVNAAREAARRMHCSWNLTQLILAVHNYETHHGVYPPGTTNPTGPILSQPVGYHHNWLVEILPFLEQGNIERMVDRSVSIYHPRNFPPRRFRIEILQCPSTPPLGPGYSAYAGMHHHLEAPIDVDNSGVFFLNSRIKYEDVLDGSSNTLFLGEKWTPKGDLGWASGTRSTLRNTGVALNVTGGIGIGGVGVGGRLLDSDRPQSFPPDMLPASEQATQDADAEEQLLTRILGASAGISQFGQSRIPVARPRDVRLAVGGFASHHPGGTQFAFGDGRVSFISATMNPPVFTAMAHRADGSLNGLIDY